MCIWLLLLNICVLFNVVTCVAAHNLSLYSDRPRLKEHMQYCMEHPEEMSKLSKLKAQISDVKGIMMDNIEKVFILWFSIDSYTRNI